MKEIVEVCIDMDRLPRGVGTVAPSGHVDFDHADVANILDWVGQKLDKNYMIHVTLRGYCPHFLLVRITSLVSTYRHCGNVVQMDYVPKGNPRFTVFHDSVEAEA